MSWKKPMSDKILVPAPREKFVIIIDEYDTPIQQGHHCNFYPEIVNFMRNPSYCAVTVSDRSQDRVTAYIEGQREKGKRK